MQVFYILALLFALAVQHGHAAVQPMEYLPPDLQSYLDASHSTGDLTQQSGQLVLWTCIQPYISKFAKTETNMTQSETKLFESTLYEIIRPLIDPAARRKRQAGPRRVRRELRSLTLDERNSYFDAVNAMKIDRTFTPSVFDVFAGLHSGANIGRAHMGPAFPSWHRLYLYIFESILRLWYDPTVTIPFWASVLDNDMFDPTTSVIWRDDFFGDGFGVVRTGPFADWRFLPGRPIRRNIGSGPLMSQTAVDRILTRRRNFEILVPTARPLFNFEDEHGGPHMFVSGTMNNLNTAAFDPVFFSHHCYVDYVWELFRIQQLNNTIDPETDYPFDTSDGRFRSVHHPNANAGFFSFPQDTVTVLGMQLASLTQSIGYSNAFFDLVQYEDTPECPNCDGSLYLYCDTGLNRCVSRGMDAPRETNGNLTTQTTTQSSMTTNPDIPADTTQTIQTPTTGSGVTSNPGTTFNPGTTSSPGTKPPNYGGSSCGSRRPFINDVDTKQIGGSGEWAYIPVNVAAKRPDTMEGYTEYSLYKSQAKWANQTSLGSKYEFVRKGSQYKYEKCMGGQGAVGKISIVSWGINYDGYAEEYIVVDNRFGVSQGSGYLPVKKPTPSNPSEFITVAYDTCGRVCKPYCNNAKHSHINENFSGGFRASSDSPLQFSNSYEEAMLSMWEMSSPGRSPVIDYGDIPITFFCEYTDKWIWDKPTPPPPPPPQPKPTYHHTKQTPQQQGTVPYETNPIYGVIVPEQPQPSYTGYEAQKCTVSTDCEIDEPCRGCKDFEFRYCNGLKKIAICIYNQFSVTANTHSYIKHFYSK